MSPIQPSQPPPPVTTRVVCGCGRSVATDVLRGNALICALVGWQLLEDRAICSKCQWEDGRVPSFARRLQISAES